MPANRQVKTALRQLPYREMRDLSGEIRQGLPEHPTVDNVAAVLSSLPMEESEKDHNENAYLMDYFGRKRAITITPHGNGWMLTCSTLDLTIHCTDLREGMSQLFDTLIGYLAITRA